MKRNLLLDEAPLLVSPTLASIIGTEDAIVLQQINYWRIISIQQGGDGWCWNTIDQWLSQFPFLKKRSLERIFSNLRELGLISIERRPFKGVRINFYTIHQHGLDKLISTRQVGVSVVEQPARLAGGVRQIGGSVVGQPANSVVSTIAKDYSSESTLRGEYQDFSQEQESPTTTSTASYVGKDLGRPADAPTGILARPGGCSRRPPQPRKLTPDEQMAEYHERCRKEAEGLARLASRRAEVEAKKAAEKAHGAGSEK